MAKTDPPDTNEYIRDLIGKLDLLVNWIDQQGLLPEHVFTFPDGDVWHAARWCGQYQPDHNGECLNCDEPADKHGDA